MADENPYTDMIKTRGSRARSPLGTTIFVGLRALDGFVLQRALQVLNPSPAWLAKLGWTGPIPPSPAGGPPLAMSDHDLTPFQAILWGMTIGSALKHIYWVLFTTKEPMDVELALPVCAFNTVFNGVSMLAFGVAAVNRTWSESAIYTAIPIYAAGILIETVSETQRKRFKDDPKNEGKPYAGGLFGYARSINYFGYTLWRTAIALAGGGWVLGALTAAFFAWDFNSRGIPSLDRYCTKRYGPQWTEVKRKVPYQFCPGVY